MEAPIATLLLENGICNAKFSPSAQACIPGQLWRIPNKEILARRDLRKILTFTIDSSSAKELDDALSIEMVREGVYRLGVHITDVAYFVQPDSALDKEAKLRSSSVYLVHNKLSMFPRQLSQGCATLEPGLDRLAVSIIWDVDSSGNILDRWIGRSVILSCSKLSYDLVEDVIDSSFCPSKLNTCTVPKIYGGYCWNDIVKSLETLHNISLNLKGTFGNGSRDNLRNAFWSRKIDRSFDCGRWDSKNKANAMVEKFMVFANESVAQVISKSLPDRALLRHHPNPSMRRLHGLEVHLQSVDIKLALKLSTDPNFFNALVSHATKPLHTASYFSTADFKGENYNWRHDVFAAAYTHFTSPLRRYPDIIVHRTLLAILDAEKVYIKKREGNCQNMARCFTGLKFDMEAVETEDGKEALLHAATKFRVPEAEVLCKLANYFNEKKAAISHVEETAKKIHLQATSQNQKVVQPLPLGAIPACQGLTTPFRMQNLPRPGNGTTPYSMPPPLFSQRLMVPLQQLVPPRALHASFAYSGYAS